MQEGAAVILITRIFGAAYVLTPLRITYAVESSGVHCIPGSEATCNIRQLPCFAKGERFDLALTSLEGSALGIEERYSVQWCQEDDSVWYEMYAISKPATLDAYLGYPLLRYYQRKVREASIAVMKKLLAPEEDTVDAAMRMWDTMKMG
ncbi:g1845 [Coccomyxa viridis]|uniref:G1845 protein n=1 Tax=Coccomyxa viridis TaxID=1274662 RepID=A0ABP1FMS6_9CHLO